MALIVSMKRKKKTEAEIAEQVGCSERTVFNYLSPNYQPHTLNKRKVAWREEAAAASRKRRRQDEEIDQNSKH